MRDWLDKTIPLGAGHTWLADAVETSIRIILAILLFLVIRWLSMRSLEVVFRSLHTRAAREGDTQHTRLDTLQGLVRSVVSYVLLFLATMTILSEVGINVAALLAGAGVAGLALSFGAQRLVRDVLTGFFLLLEDQYRVGEVVTLMGVPGMAQAGGTVLEMGLRTTRLQDVSGKLVTVSNGDIGAVVNHSRGPITATVELGIPVETPLDRVRAVVAAVPLPDNCFSGHAEVQGVTALEASRVVVRVSAPARPGQAPEAELALRQALGEALRQADIQIK